MKGHIQDLKSQGGLKALILTLAVAIFPFTAQAGEAVNYVVEGETFEGYRAKANDDSKGLVLIIHESGEVKNIACYASFHGGLETPEGQTYRSDTPPILIAHGGADTSVRWMTWRTFHASWRAQACLTESRSIRGAAWLHRARLRPLPRAR
jgi:hypothetical protein